jgi:NADPH:quinone reductase-like Zn-dependent oxidoreductase
MKLIDITKKIGRLMQAIVYTKYRPPDVLQLKEVEKPIPNDDEVLVKVRSASVNSVDVTMSKGAPSRQVRQMPDRKTNYSISFKKGEK